MTDIMHVRSLKPESTISLWKENRKHDLFVQQMTTASMKLKMWYNIKKNINEYSKVVGVLSFFLNVDYILRTVYTSTFKRIAPLQ